MARRRAEDDDFDDFEPDDFVDEELELFEEEVVEEAQLRRQSRQVPRCVVPIVTTYIWPQCWRVQARGGVIRS